PRQWGGSAPSTPAPCSGAAAGRAEPSRLVGGDGAGSGSLAFTALSSPGGVAPVASKRPPGAGGSGPGRLLLGLPSDHGVACVAGWARGARARSARDRLLASALAPSSRAVGSRWSPGTARTLLRGRRPAVQGDPRSWLPARGEGNRCGGPGAAQRVARRAG